MLRATFSVVSKHFPIVWIIMHFLIYFSYEIIFMIFIQNEAYGILIDESIFQLSIRAESRFHQQNFNSSIYVKHNFLELFNDC